HAVWVAHGLARADAEHYVVCLVVFAEEIVRVVCGDERDACAFRERDEVAVDPLLVGKLVILYFEEVVAAAQYVLELARGALSLFELSVFQMRLRHARQAGGESDESAAEF